MRDSVKAIHSNAKRKAKPFVQTEKNFFAQDDTLIEDSSVLEVFSAAASGGALLYSPYNSLLKRKSPDFIRPYSHEMRELSLSNWLFGIFEK